MAALETDGARWPLKLHRTYKGHEFTASLDRDSGVTVLGKEYQTLSGAAHAAMTSVSGVPKSVTVNGWGFWKYAKRDGQSVTVGSLAPKDE